MTNASMSIGKPEAGAHAPGKLILSGEHSVIYGAPALAIAIARYTEVWFTPMGLGTGLSTAFANLSSGATYPLQLLSKFKSSLDSRFDQFARGELKVQEVLRQPDDLAVYTLASLLQDKPANRDAIPGFGAMGALPSPGELGSRSDLPVGAGMGSSAAIVAATTVLFEGLLKRPKTEDERLERVRFCERLKHGVAGPIDASAVVRGGLVQVESAQKSANACGLPAGHSLVTGDGWFWVLHGRPVTGTGECVSAVRAAHSKDHALWADFAACTRAIEAALLSRNDPSAALTENQRLLERIGVVPEATQSFVRAVEAAGGAAKICGAGAVRGDKGGTVLVRLESAEAMKALMSDHPGMAWDKLQMSPTGAAAGPAPKPVQGFVG
ncbi:MAG: GHMP kinase [Pseudomonadota bacterium]